ncbi:MAG: ParB/RepB/Spo0J family partition protein [Saprospiraceae bacterium]
MAKIDPKALKAKLKNTSSKKPQIGDLKSNLSHSGIAKKPQGRGRNAVLPSIKPTDFLMVSIDKIEPNKYQPRQDFDPKALEELANSIEEFGVIQPITVRADEKYETFQLISGERRWRASQLAGLTEIPAYIRTPNDQELAEMALVENLFREDLNPIEVAMTYSRLMEEFDLNQEALAKRVEKGRTTITNFLRLLKLSDTTQNKLREGAISMGHAKALAGLEDVVVQRQLTEQIISKDLSVRATEELVKNYKGKGGKKSSSKPNLSPEYRKVQDNLRSRFGSGKIRLEVNAQGKGQIVLPFQSSDELNDLLEHLED